ncbi:serine hydrolase [Candidatus Microgenomates bacterium]|nr:serine hydrolase [Candidatus Microgenomates bacterium]
MLSRETNLTSSYTRREALKILGGSLAYPFISRFEVPQEFQRTSEYGERWNTLQTTIDTKIKRYRNFSPYAEVSISLLDLQTDARISLDGDIPRQPGCVINQFVLYSLIEDFRKGLYGYQPLARSIYLAVGESKAAAAEELLRRYVGQGSAAAGATRINQMIGGLGLTTAFFDHPPAFPHKGLEGRPNLMTADEAVDIMAKLYRNQIFKDQKWTDFAIQRLVEGKPGLNYMVGIGVRSEPGVRVAHKIGYFSDPDDSWRDVECDAGLILINNPGTPNGEIAYAMAIFSKGNTHSPSDRPSILYDGWFTWHVSRAAYNFFKKQYF